MGTSLNAGPIWRNLRVAAKGKIRMLAGSTLQFDYTSRLALAPGTLPATCAKGELAVDTAGILYIATATNTWTKVGVQV